MTWRAWADWRVWAQAGVFWALPIAYISFRGFRSPTQRFLNRWTSAYGIELTESNRLLIVTYLRRTKRIRTAGALAGLLFSVVWMTITENSNSFLGNGLYLAVVGYLLGTILAETAVPRPARGSTRMASLIPRTLRDYLPGYANVMIRGLPALSVSLIPVYALVKEHSHVPIFHTSVVGFAVISGALVLVAGVIELVQRMIVRRPQPVLSPDLVAADDAIRAASLHALAGSGVALALLGLSYQVAAIGNGIEPPFLGWFLPLSAFIMLGLALRSWIDLAHPRKFRVRRHVHQGSEA
jgi:hypothetical protein